MTRYRQEDLKHLCRSILAAAGVDPGDAAIVADNLVCADRRGIPSHGLARLPLYEAKVRAGSIQKKTLLSHVRETSASVLIDAGNGWGAVAGTYAMGQAINKARLTGAAVAGVRASNHFGIAAYYGFKAAEEGMIGIALTNAVPAVAPWGGTDAYLGTNPICVCVPNGRARPLVYDGATSVVAKGKVVLAKKAGTSIPPTWAADRRGRPTTDPDQALEGTLLPIGGYKGSGLSLAFDILSGVLTGAAFGGDVGSLFNPSEVANIGHFFAAVDIEAFMPMGEFQERLSRMMAGFRSSKLADGFDRILLPGEIEAENEIETARSGIELRADILRDLEDCARRYGLSLPEPLEASMVDGAAGAMGSVASWKAKPRS